MKHFFLYKSCKWRKQGKRNALQFHLLPWKRSRHLYPFTPFFFYCQIHPILPQPFPVSFFFLTQVHTKHRWKGSIFMVGNDNQGLLDTTQLTSTQFSSLDTVLLTMSYCNDKFCSSTSCRFIFPSFSVTEPWTWIDLMWKAGEWLESAVTDRKLNQECSMEGTTLSVIVVNTLGTMEGTTKDTLGRQRTRKSRTLKVTELWPEGEREREFSTRFQLLDDSQDCEVH